MTGCACQPETVCGVCGVSVPPAQRKIWTQLDDGSWQHMHTCSGKCQAKWLAGRPGMVWIDSRPGVLGSGGTSCV